MGRSSIVFCCVCVLSVTPAVGQGRAAVQRGGMGLHGAMMVRNPTNVGSTLAMRPARPVFRVRPQRLAMGTGRLRPVARRGRLGVDAVGLGLAMVNDLLVNPSVATEGYGPSPEPAVIPALVPPRCPRPQIIRIGLGLRHVARTRVIYGTTAACMP